MENGGPMRNRGTIVVKSIILLICGVALTAAEKELVYDAEKGIILVEKKAGAASALRAKKSAQRSMAAKSAGRGGADLHVGRKKDPPDLYFRSGLEYYKNGDYDNALKNFTFADSVGHRPEYRLWIGKALRQLDRVDDMLLTMFTIIKNEPDCDVADDALLELALYYKTTDDYDRATQLFSQLVEQYPFGTAFSTGEELREIVREQRRLMRAEMLNSLSILGYMNEDLSTAFRNFQKANNLPVTEVGDRQTVRAIKQQQHRYQEMEELKERQKQRFDGMKVWIYAALGAGSLNIFLLVMLSFQIRARKRQVSELQKNITDLDVRKL